MRVSDSPRSSRLELWLLVGVLALLAWSAWRPVEGFTWALEVFPAVIGLVILGVTHRRFPLTSLLYTLIALHMALLIVGGHYTYAHVPLGLWVKDWLHLERNHYDRLGHFTQGFVPAVLAREVLLRCTPLKRGGWLSTIVICVCMAISAVYELVEWLVSAVSGDAGNEFLGTQGDFWDTQKDMAMCLVGAVAALLVMSRWHDRQLAPRGWAPATR